jgi:hypothetical protein
MKSNNKKQNKMKKLFKLTLTLALLFSTVLLFAQNDKEKEHKRYEHFKERNISKTYPASGNSLSIENSFGDVVVTTWDKNEIKVDVHIEASSDDKDYAEKNFARIDVTDSKDGNKINFKTTHKNEKDNSCKNCKSNMQINYTIQMPASNTLSIENQFGAIKLPDYNGTVSLTSKFGSLTAGNLPKTDKLNVEFGNAEIKSVSNVNAVFKFSKINVENISGSNKIDMEFCSFSKMNLTSDLTSLTIRESYSTINLRPAANLSANYYISTSFGSFKNKTNADIKRTDTPDKYGPDSDKKYEGKSGTGTAKVDVKSSFGTVILGDATEEEMKSKNKEKNKEKKIEI